MTTRTTINTVTFKRPFVLGDFDEVQPAGAYRVETDEELLEFVSFPAYRRTLTMIHLHASSDHPGRTQMLDIDPNDLDAALARDQAAADLPADLEAGDSVKARPSGLEPDLEEMMADPIVRSVMCSDGLSQVVAWDAIRAAREQMASDGGANARMSVEDLRRLDADRSALERGENEGMLVLSS
jgi:hypothetical protein